VPRADQASLLVEAAVGHVGAQVPASARHREQFPGDVADGIASSGYYRPGWQVGHRSHLVLTAHTFTVHPSSRVGQPIGQNRFHSRLGRVAAKTHDGKTRWTGMR
jgi:hypothetical protein